MAFCSSIVYSVLKNPALQKRGKGVIVPSKVGLFRRPPKTHGTHVRQNFDVQHCFGSCREFSCVVANRCFPGGCFVASDS